MMRAGIEPLSINRLRIVFAAMLMAALLGACGFQLRGTATLPFQTLYVEAPPGSAFATQLRRAIGASSNTRVIDDPQAAEARILVVQELREKEVVSLSSGGRAREFQLRYRMSYRVVAKDNAEITPLTQILLRRDLTYSEQDVLGKEAEENLLYRDMQSDAVQQLLRRLQTISTTAKS